MKNFYYTVLFLGLSLLVSAQDLGGTPVEGLIPIKRINTSETIVNNKKTSVTAKTAAVTTTPAPTGSSTEVGITEGQFSVSLSGGATYAIPIAVPPGINGVVPQVGLGYNSQGSNGMAGYGWNISGVSAITRIPRTKFHDGIIGGVNLDANDRFALDGQRLILKTGTSYGAAGTIYETENFSNLKITAVGVSPMGANYGPASFKVEYPDGSKAEYGLAADSRSITTWSITYWENPQGVRISYSYNLTNNSLSIKAIKYGTIGTIAPINEIQFVYAPRKRPEQSYLAGQSIWMNTILTGIKVVGNAVGFRNYVLVPKETTLGYERLESITEKSGDGTKSYNPTVFTYETTSETISYDGIGTSFLSVGDITSKNSATVSGDFDGDERTELLMYPTTGNSKKSKYWMFSNFTSNTNLNIGYEHNVGAFEDIFPVSWLTFTNKLWTKQGWAVAKKTDTNYSFKVYCAGTTTPISYQYERVVNFPTLSVGVFGDICQIIQTNKIIPKKILSGDFNGDGLTDVIALDIPGLSSIQSGNCSSYSSNPILSKKAYFIDLKRDNTTNFLTYAGELQSLFYSNEFNGSERAEVYDVNADGKSDFLIIAKGKITAYTMNNANQLVRLWEYSDINITNDYTKPNYTMLFGDYNGDGNLDFIIPKVFNGYSYAKYSSTGKSFLKEDATYEIPFNANYGNECPGVFHILPNDFDGDGKTDLILVKNVACPSTSGQGYISIRNYKNTGTNFVSNMYATTEVLAGIGAYAVPVILNSDKLNVKQEINFITNNKIFSFQSQKDFSKEKLLKTITTGNGVRESISYESLTPASLSDDGYTPIYTPSLFIENYPQTDIESAEKIQVVIKLEKQSASVYKKQLFSYAGATTNLEGLGFLGFRANMRTNWFDDTTSEPSTSFITSSISKFDTNLRGANVASYTYLGLYSPTIAVSATAPKTPRASAIIINNTITASQTVQATNSIRFLPGATISPTTGNTFIAQITADYDANGFAQTNTTPPTNLISKSLSFYAASLSPTKVYKLQNTQSNTYNILENTSSETVTVYDIANNPTESISKIRNAGVGEQTTITSIEYQQPLTTSRPVSKIQTVTSSGDSMTSKEVYGYGSTTESNLLKKIEKWGNNTNVITEDNSYDAFGNITKKTITATGLTPRVTNYEYNPASPYNGRFLTKSTDIEVLSTLFDYNTSNGNLVSELLPSKPGYPLLTTYIYNDPWFKKTKTIDYLGKSNTYAYTRTGNVDTKITTTGDDGSYSEELFDDLGRKIQSGIKDLQGIILSYKDYKYDIYDRNFSVSEPHRGTPSLWSTTTYDVYGRPKTVTDFKTKVMSIDYDKLTTTITDGSTLTTKKSTKNALGNVVKLEETPGGIINYSYFANSNLKETEYAGTKITITQDGWGRKTSLVDPAAGSYFYEYNALGEITKETTPNGATTYNLDAVGKPDLKTVAGPITDSKTKYYYYPDKLLQKTVYTDVKDGNKEITIEYFYDAEKRLEKTVEKTGYGAIFSKTLAYDAWGRVKTETSKAELNGKSSEKKIRSEYKNGFAYQIIDDATGTVLWETNEVNARGQLTKATLGNRIGIVNTYDSSDFGYLTSTEHTLPATTPKIIMKLTNDFDPQRGNLNWRENSLFGSVRENFTYDKQDRLISYPNTNGLGVLTQTYEDDGRIKTNVLGTYNYANTAKKYQNTSVTLNTEPLPYYKNRGIVALPSPTATRALTVTYNTFKSPVEITEDGVDKLSFVYNDNNDRSAMFYGSTNPDKALRPNRKYYSADGSMEIKATFAPGNTTTPIAIEFVTYIGGDGYSAPIVLKSDGTTQNYLYLHRDYQGSILAITDANANVLEKRLFDAWGAILKVQNGAGVDLNGLTILDRGYTGHEHLQSVGIINMNGRIYDPKLHRFLQPDNYVQDPSNTQNYNRYAYVMNNPLMYTDPSGEFFLFALAAALFTTDIGYDVQKMFSPIAIKVDVKLGNQQIGLGINASVGVPTFMGFSYRENIGATYFFKNYGGYSGWETRRGKEYSLFNFIKFGSTNYKAGEFTQSVGYIKTGLLPSLNGIEVTNDLFGDEGDRFRTAHQKINFGGLSVGNIIFTGDPSVYNNALIPGGGRNTYLNGPYGANKYGNGIFYFGSGIFRAGWDSEEIRNTFQNIIGHDIFSPSSPYIYKTDRKPNWYWLFGGGLW